MEIAGGTFTALVGPSGSGKTSCLSLLKRLYEAQEGEILLDGKPLHHYKRKYLHRKVGSEAAEARNMPRKVSFYTLD